MHLPRTVVIPLAGVGARFREKGYTTPKYLLPVRGLSIIEHILSAVDDTQDICLILNRRHENSEIIKWLEGYNRIVTRVFIDESSGQLDTVQQGLRQYFKNGHKSDFAIFNGDTVRHEPFAVPSKDVNWVEVSRLNGDHWSFVDRLGRVSRLTEKERISPYCSTGLYYFRDYTEFLDVLGLSAYLNLDGSETFVAPFYNHFIQAELPVSSFELPPAAFEFCGTPEEYENTISST
jgi:NDP-sugar pyrophosphorylase family protein